jgi:predicted phage terminase large subunit-like protein
LTGRCGDIIVIDDPLKPDDALSETKRLAANQWFTNTLLSHLDDKRTGAIVVVMQRLHVDDLTGFLLAQSDDGMSQSPRYCGCRRAHSPFCRTQLSRKQGEALSPEREPLTVLNALKLQIGSDAFSVQYQQAPAPPSGAMVKRAWIRRFSELPPLLERLFTLQSWDTATKGGPENDWPVCTTWIVARKKQWYLIDVWRGRVDYPALKMQVQTLAKRWEAQRVLVEDTGAGTSLVQELRGEVDGIVGVKPEGDKASRMAVASAKFEAGQVLLPERAPWLPDLEAELFVFPRGRHDDQCDSISQALLDKNNSFMMWMTPEDWDHLFAGLGIRPRNPFLILPGIFSFRTSRNSLENSVP